MKKNYPIEIVHLYLFDGGSSIFRLWPLDKGCGDHSTPPAQSYRENNRWKHSMLWPFKVQTNHSWADKSLKWLTMSNILWICWMFYDHLSAHSPLTPWGWLMKMRLAWKKSQKTLDASKRLHQNKTRSTRSAGKGLDSQLCHYWELQTQYVPEMT